MSIVNLKIIKFNIFCLDVQDDIISELKQDDPRLIKLIQKWFLEPKPDAAVPYNFNVPTPDTYGQIGIPRIVDKLLGEKKNGFFIGMQKTENILS